MSKTSVPRPTSIPSGTRTKSPQAERSKRTAPEPAPHPIKLLLDRYVAVAMRTALPRQLEGEIWYADLPNFPGVWADGPSPKQCLDTLEEVLRDWLLLKIVDQDQNIPVVDEIDLNAL